MYLTPPILSEDRVCTRRSTGTEPRCRAGRWTGAGGVSVGKITVLVADRVVYTLVRLVYVEEELYLLSGFLGMAC